MTSELPRYALSVRQPWAWAIIHAGKHLENRSAASVKHMPRTPGMLLAIHAAKGMTRDEYESARHTMQRLCNVECPRPDALIRSAVIGFVRYVDTIKQSASPWWMGPRALLLDQPQAVEPIACFGALGFFDWRNGLDGNPRTMLNYREPKIAEPLPWMKAWPHRFHPYAKAEDHIIRTVEPESLPLFEEGKGE